MNLQDFDFVVEKIAANYAGYDTKVTSANRQELADLTARLRGRASRASEAEFSAILTEWIGYFRDEHTRVTMRSLIGSAPVTDAPRLDWTEPSIVQRLSAMGTRRDPIEGIWSISGDRYRVGIMRTSPERSEYAAVVLTTTSESWSPGEIKISFVPTASGAFQTTYRLGDHSEQQLSAHLVADDQIIDLGRELGAVEREWPRPRNADAIARMFPSSDLFLRRLSATTLWLRIPDFHDERAAPLRTLLTEHADELAHTPNLILDLRNNGGGSDYVYRPLLPLIYTRPIYSIGMEMRASEDNIALRHAVAQSISDADQSAELERQNQLMSEHLGEYIQPDPAPFSIYRQDNARQFPQQVAVLIDGAGSTAEQFLLDARQSDKVTLFGQRNSEGVLDFANVVTMQSPSGRVTLQWATSRSLRLPLDPVDPEGIAPEVRIPASEREPIGYVQQWLERGGRR